VMRDEGGSSAIGGSLAALAGIALLVGFGGQGGLLGDVLAFGMTLSMAAIMVIARRFRDIAVMPAACMSGLLSSLLAWPFGTPLAVSSWELALLALFGMASAIGLALFTLGARLLPAVETALIGTLDTPLAPLWVWLFFAETPDLATVTGGLIVFGAVGVHVVRSTRET
ncbi:EamA family transporter, partial [Rhizobiaceae sp. 2RAB30]